jgi:ABC-type polysaccharide/polyol phosphate transport system ATPase subunit
LPTSSRKLALEAVGLRKDYQLGELADITARIARLRGKTGLDNGRSEAGRDLAALMDLNFEVEKGECLGVVGTNGSGKSTLVQIISGITIPSEGVMRVRGRVLPLLEVGAVFNDELTGRENVTLFGTVLGLSRREINEAMPSIATFGDIDEWHMDTPLKRHSTGMRARLCFAVAMRFPADIYIFDEVIAVVDDHFRARAAEEISGLVAAGRTVIFISHDLDLVRSLCTKCLWLDRGRMRAFGDVREVADAYADDREADEAARAELSAG